MASFVTDLWESIFTPGPTPTLLIATNVTFASLQVVLFSLLLATYSIHFVILSFLSAGLWWSINWFARELKVHQEQEEEKARRAKETPIGNTSATSDSETEVEGTSSGASQRRGRKPVRETEMTSETVTGSNEVEVVEQQGELKQRDGVAGESASASSQGSKSGVSTEDEWEKISENETEKTK